MAKLQIMNKTFINISIYAFLSVGIVGAAASQASQFGSRLGLHTGKLFYDGKMMANF